MLKTRDSIRDLRCGKSGVRSGSIGVKSQGSNQGRWQPRLWLVISGVRPGTFGVGSHLWSTLALAHRPGLVRNAPRIECLYFLETIITILFGVSKHREFDPLGFAHHPWTLGEGGCCPQVAMPRALAADQAPTSPASKRQKKKNPEKVAMRSNLLVEHIVTKTALARGTPGRSGLRVLIRTGFGRSNGDCFFMAAVITKVTTTPALPPLPPRGVDGSLSCQPGVG